MDKSSNDGLPIKLDLFRLKTIGSAQLIVRVRGQNVLNNCLTILPLLLEVFQYGYNTAFSKVFCMTPSTYALLIDKNISVCHYTTKQT